MTDAPAQREAWSAWAKLRRRKVVQWGLTYSASAWVFLQGLEYAVETFGWPESIRPLVTLALVSGLPLVLILAWYHGDRGQQRVTGGEFVWLALFAVLGVGGLWLYQRQGEAPTPPRSTSTLAAAPTPAEERPSIAVLPFENRSHLQDDAFFVDGVHDDILTQLAKIGSLKVIARTSVEQFRDTTMPTRAIAEQLGVTNILEGGVQRAGDRVRINVQLIDGRTDAHLWADTYDHELTVANIFAIQSEVAARIATALEASLTTAERESVSAIPTENFDAWVAYQLGKQRMARRTSEALAEAEAFFTRAIELDPKFALAHAGLGDTLILQIDYSSAPRAARLAQADSAIRAALAIDQGLAEAWASSGLINANAEHYDQAWEEFRRAIALKPNYATAHHWFSHWLGRLGRNEEALAYAEQAAELDPLSAIINVNLGEQLGRNGRFDEAEQRFRKAIEIDDSMPSAYAELGRLMAYARADFVAAVHSVETALELDPGNPEHSCLLATLQLDLDNDTEAARIIGEALERWPEEACVRSTSAVVWAYQNGMDSASLQIEAIKLADEGLSRFVSAYVDIAQGRFRAARDRYAEAYPDWLREQAPGIDRTNWEDAITYALILEKCGEPELATALLAGSEKVIRTMPRLGVFGYGIGDAEVLALRGSATEALAALREAARAGWRGPYWRWARDLEQRLESIRREPEFAAVFSEIERDIAAQRADLDVTPNLRGHLELE